MANLMEDMELGMARRVDTLEDVSPLVSPKLRKRSFTATVQVMKPTVSQKLESSKKADKILKARGSERGSILVSDAFQFAAFNNEIQKSLSQISAIDEGDEDESESDSSFSGKIREEDEYSDTSQSSEDSQPSQNSDLSSISSPPPQVKIQRSLDFDSQSAMFADENRNLNPTNSMISEFSQESEKEQSNLF